MNPSRVLRRAFRTRVYPRARGESVAFFCADNSNGGLSPRTRGIRLVLETALSRQGSIPAHAGNPGRLVTVRLTHPGLSPRTRGILGLLGLMLYTIGSIPAHAGNPIGLNMYAPHYGVYPRARGESLVNINSLSIRQGLSPRTRGILRLAVQSNAIDGSIPAHAGNPNTSFAKGRLWRVYPRARGESAIAVTGALALVGLSPRTRGILCKALWALFVLGSIPAHAGNPFGNCASTCSFRVYPRARGESCDRLLYPFSVEGLSPRTRGIQPHLMREPVMLGSIPAHAGNPSIRPQACRSSRVYPRARGES